MLRWFPSRRPRRLRPSVRRFHRLVLAAFVLCAVSFGGDSAALPQAAAEQASGRSAERAPELEAAVRALVSDRTLKDAQVGIVITDVESGAVLAQANEHLLLNPASNAKLYTAAAALALLHGSHRYQTTLSGTIEGNAVTGSLILRGQGDPSLQTSDLWRLAHELKQRGVRRVEGDVVVEQSFFDEKTTPPAFEQQPGEWASFRAPVSAVAVNENTLTLFVRPTANGSPAVAWFDPPGFVDVEGTVKTGAEGADSVVLALAPSGRRMSAKISGTVGEGAKLVRYTRRVEDPQLLAGYVLRSVLEEVGIKVAGDVKLGTTPAKAPVLLRHESEPLSTLLYALGKNSDNFYAEMVFKSLAAESKRPAKSDEAAAVVTKWLEKNQLLDEGLVVKNGSGLFDANRTTAHAVAKLLRAAWQDTSVRNEYVAQLAIGGVDGTLHKRFRSHRNHRAIRAKTGTLDDAIALSGYVLSPTGKNTVAFSILFNKVSGKAAAARASADKLVELVHDRLWR